MTIKYKQSLSLWKTHSWVKNWRRLLLNLLSVFKGSFTVSPMVVLHVMRTGKLFSVCKENKFYTILLLSSVEMTQRQVLILLVLLVMTDSTS